MGTNLAVGTTDEARPRLESFLNPENASVLLIEIAGNRPLLLEGRGNAWLVRSGELDIFAVQVVERRPAGPFRHLFRATCGQVLFGIDLSPTGEGIALLARGEQGTLVVPLPVAQLYALATDPQATAAVIDALDAWTIGLGRALAGEEYPHAVVFLAPDGETTIEDQQIAIPQHGVLWVRLVAGAANILNEAGVPLVSDQDFIPVSRDLWLQAHSSATLYAVHTATLLRHDEQWQSLAAFHTLVLQRLLLLTARREEQAERKRLARKAETQRTILQQARVQLGAFLDADRQPAVAMLDGTADPLLSACRMVGTVLGIAIQAPPGAATESTTTARIRGIARASTIRTRQVGLRGEWWRHDHGPLVAIVDEFERPVALLPASDRSYVLHDPVSRMKQVVTAELAATLAPFATTFYRSLPPRPVTTWDLVRFGLYDCRKDLQMVVIMGTGIGLLGLLTPLVTGYVFDSVIPGGERGQLIQVGLVLLVVAVAMAMFSITQSVALLRTEGKLSRSIQAAVWDRLLNLPVPFFHQFTAGDLGVRAMGIDAVSDAVSGPVISSVLASIFSVFSLGLLFYLDSRLALVGTALVLIAVVATMVAGALQLRYYRLLTEVEGRIAGLVLQLIGGIAKFRVAGMEGRVFAVWAEEFRKQKELEYRAGRVENSLMVFQAVYPVVTAMTLFGMIALAGATDLSTGTFLAFLSAFGQLLVAALTLSSAAIAILAVMPLYERAKPILHTLPEIEASKSEPGHLTGAIEISHLAFRYKTQAPRVLHDISFQVAPGEFVAVVGPSGSGKSTLFRLLLGFEAPESGAIYYDGRDLSRLDLRAVRQQIGVVLQNGKLLAGSILDNIIGSSLLTVDDAWDAARMAGLDADIHEMPMGMHTFISEGGGTLSGGQRQRLLIARAIVKRPHIVLFDEATSALDNRTQQIVSQSLERLQATRIVIAHRLSTIMAANRIFVIEQGRIVQSGSYETLIAEPGPFLDLARRQLV